ncbi:hypothetical protein [Rhizobium sp.]
MAISETAGVITHSSRFPAWARIFVGVLGAVTVLLGPATMISIAAPGWTLSFALTVFTGTALFLFGVFALVVSLSAAVTLEFRIAERLLVVTKRGPLGRSRAQYGFDDVREPSLSMRDSEDGAYPVLTLRVGSSHARLEMTGFADEGDARRWLGRIADVLINPA